MPMLSFWTKVIALVMFMAGRKHGYRMAGAKSRGLREQVRGTLCPDIFPES